VLVVAPLLLGAALSLATTLSNEWLVQRLLEIPPSRWPGSSACATPRHSCSRRASPSCTRSCRTHRCGSARRRSAGSWPALLVILAQNAYLGFSVGAARANTLYGGFALLPLLFVWIYVSGRSCSSARRWPSPTRASRSTAARCRGAPPDRPSARRWGCGSRSRSRAASRRGAALDGRHALGGLRVPVRTVRGVLADLETAGVVAALDAAGTPGPGSSAARPRRSSSATCSPRWRGPRDPASGEPALSGAVASLFAELAEAEAKGAGGRSLAEVLAAAAPAARARVAGER